MKNKFLILVIVLIFGTLGVQFALGKNQLKAEKKELPTIGVLQFVSHPALDEIHRGIEDGLKERGYEDGKSAKIIFQNGQADQSKLSTMSQQLRDKKADVLIGIATPAAQALANSTQDIPIILGAISDPVGAGLVKDVKKPGGNITGVGDIALVDVQFDLLREIFPEAKTVGVLFSSAEDNSRYLVGLAEKEGTKRGLEVKKYPVPSGNEVSQMVQVMAEEVDVIFIPNDNTIANAMQTVVDIANKSKTPIIPSVDTMVEQGGLATVGVNQYDMGVQTGYMAADVLEGKSDPATTPIFSFKTGDIILNKKQAELLEVSIPKKIQEQAIVKE